MIEKPAHLIGAIKIIRNLPVSIVEKTNENGVKFQSVQVNISLIEAKSLVEAIMELANAKDNTELFNLKEDIKFLNRKVEDLHKVNDDKDNRFYELKNKIHSLLDNFYNSDLKF